MKISKGYDFFDKVSKDEPYQDSFSLTPTKDDYAGNLQISGRKQENGDSQNGKNGLKRRIDEPLQREDQKQMKKTNDRNGNHGNDEDEETKRALKLIEEQEELERKQKEFGDYVQKAYRMENLQDNEKTILEERAAKLTLICDFGPSKILVSGYQSKIDEFVVYLKQFLAEKKKRGDSAKKEIPISSGAIKFASYIEQKGLDLGIICEVHEKSVLAEGNADKIDELENFIKEKEKEALATPKKVVQEETKSVQKEIPLSALMKKSQVTIEKKAEELGIICEFTEQKFIMLGSSGNIAELLGYLLELEASPQKKEEEETGEYIQEELKLTKAFNDNMPEIKKKVESLDVLMDIEGDKVFLTGFDKRLKEIKKFLDEKEKETKANTNSRPASASITTGDKGDFVQKEISISTFHRARQAELEKKAEELELICDFGYDVVLITGTKSTIGEFIAHLYETESEAKKALYPKYWDFHEINPFSMETIPNTSPEFQEVDVLFQKTMRGHNIHLMQRIQNKYLMDHYATNIQKRMESRPNEAINRMLLFHGTRATKPEVIYKNFDVGFDLQYANQGMYGKGLYFAVNANYSHNGFVYRNSRGNCQLIVADVFVGKAANSGGGNIIKAPEGYDSVSAGGQFYILYNNFHSYPLYLIEYK